MPFLSIIFRFVLLNVSKPQSIRVFHAVFELRLQKVFGSLYFALFQDERAVPNAGYFSTKQTFVRISSQ